MLMTNFTVLTQTRGILLRGALLVLAASMPVAASPIIVGLPPDSGSGNCFPFGCSYATIGGTGEYQQVYTNTLFSNPITITGLEFFNTQDNSDATAMNTGTFTIFLSTTSANWNSLSSTFANNLGPNNTEVFSGSLAQPWAFGDTLVISFSTPFTYVPAPGANLLLTVVATGTGDAGGAIFFDSNGYNGGGFNGNTIFGRVFSASSTNIVEAGYGLVTGFTVIPEPASFVLCTIGVIGIAALGCRRRDRRPS
jgi:hypothetical protein